MGELHLEIIVDRMKREFKVDGNVGAPQVAYRETITKLRRNRLHPQEAVRRLPASSPASSSSSSRLEPGSRVSSSRDEIRRRQHVPKEYIPGVQKGLNDSDAKAGVHRRLPDDRL